MPGDSKEKASNNKSGDKTNKTETKKKPQDEPKEEPTLFQELKSNLDFIVKAVETRSNGPILRVLRRTNLLQRNLPPAGLGQAVQLYISDAIPCKKPVLAAIEDVLPNQAEKAAAAHAAERQAATGKPEELGELAPQVQSAGHSARPVIEAYLMNICLKKLLCHNKYVHVKELAPQILDHFSQFNQRQLDVLTAQTMSFLSLAHETLKSLPSIRPFLLKAHRTACLQHNEYGQATIINLLLRNFLSEDLYDQAARLVAKVTFPEISLNQHVRFLYYQGRIGCVQLDYSQAKEHLAQASRKAPQNTAVGFRVAVTKLSIIVQLLMGDIPKRSLFSEASTAEAVAPYLELTQAVRFGRLDVFNEVTARFEEKFRRDSNFNLIQRLRQTVLKIGLRRMNKAYSCISFKDIAAKLKLDSALDAEYVCAKNIRDGVIKATLDHEGSCMRSLDQADLYSTSEPQQTFHNRIAFCLQMHDDAVKAMRYPPNAFRTNTGEDAVIEELDVGEIVEDDDDESD